MHVRFSLEFVLFCSPSSFLLMLYWPCTWTHMCARVLHYMSVRENCSNLHLSPSLFILFHFFCLCPTHIYIYIYIHTYIYIYRHRHSNKIEMTFCSRHIRIVYFDGQNSSASNRGPNNAHHSYAFLTATAARFTSGRVVVLQINKQKWCGGFTNTIRHTNIAVLVFIDPKEKIRPKSTWAFQGGLAVWRLHQQKSYLKLTTQQEPVYIT